MNPNLESEKYIGKDDELNNSDERLEEKIFNTALVATQAAGASIRKKLNTALQIDYKGRADMVTEVDRESERIIIEIIKSEFPEHQFLAEETPQVERTSVYKWIIDPLDGTTNFIHSLPIFAVSIGLEYDSDVIMGIVFHPMTGELFTAIKGKGAYLNKQRISVSRINTLSHSLLATGFPYELNRHFYTNMEFFRKFYEKCHGIRRLGSAAIDLCYTACGRFDGFWEYDLHPWDMAAGSLIITEAGGEITDFQGNPFSIYQSEILATNGHITREMIEILDSQSEWKL